VSLLLGILDIRGSILGSKSYYTDWDCSLLYFSFFNGTTSLGGTWPPLCGYRHSCLDCAINLQFLHPTCATPSNSSHHLRFGLPLFLPPVARGLVQRTFLAGSLSSLPTTCRGPLCLLSLINFTSCLS
jgi:hypothetical protein